VSTPAARRALLDEAIDARAAVLGCQAKTPGSSGWMACGTVPAPHVFLYQCPCGHRLIGRTCGSHQPGPESVPGCAECFGQRHDCQMQWRSL
jgi:hypothetical protein